MKFPDLTKRISGFGTIARKLFFRGAVTGMGALALSPAVPADASAQPPPDSSAVVTLLNRERRSPLGKLVLQLVNSSGRVLLASHGSHRSHSSHSSHSSHYSSSRSPSVVPSQPEPPPPAPSVVPHRQESSQRLLTDAGERLIEITLTRYTVKQNLRESSISGTTATGLSITFLLSPETMIQRLNKPESARSLSEILATKGSKAPLHARQKIVVAWKTDPASPIALATKIAIKSQP